MCQEKTGITLKSKACRDVGTIYFLNSVDFIICVGSMLLSLCFNKKGCI